GISYAVARTSVTGEVTAKAVEEQIRPSTKLVLVLHASNVCGTILPIEEIGAVCRKHGVFFAVDTAQSAG
ncbi:aminotransferase class V-fold PLP-dependent enzyme, partial [Eubacterium callanderi]